MSLFQSLVSGGNETTPTHGTVLCRESTDEADLGGSRDYHESGPVEESSSWVPQKKLQRITMASDQNFLDYLLNFDLNSVTVVNTGIGSMTNGATPQNKNACTNPSFSPAVCEDTSHSPAQSILHQGYSNPVLTSCYIDARESCADEQFSHSGESDESQSILIGLIHDQGLTSSPEPQVGLEKIGQVEPTKEPIAHVHSINSTFKKTAITQLFFKESQQEHTSSPLSTSDTNDVSTKRYKTNLDNLSSVTYGDVLVGSKAKIFTELVPAELNIQSNVPEKSIKELQQKQEGEVDSSNFSPCHVSSADNHGIICNGKPCGGGTLLSVRDTSVVGALDLQVGNLFGENQLLVSIPSSKTSNDEQMNINSSRKIPADGDISRVPLVSECAKDDNAASDNTKSFADSDCTVIEEQELVNTHDNGREDVTVHTRLNPAPVVSTYEGETQDKQHESCKTSKGHREKPTESTTHPLNTECSVSLLTDVYQKPLCLLPTPDSNQGKESTGQDCLQKAVENEEASYRANLSMCKKKQFKHNHRKKMKQADVHQEGKVISNRISIWIFLLDKCQEHITHANSCKLRNHLPHYIFIYIDSHKPCSKLLPEKHQQKEFFGRDSVTSSLQERKPTRD